MTALLLFASAIYLTDLQAQVIDDFYLENLENEQVSLDEIKGEQLTIIDFWATWCKPCKKAIPKLNDIFLQYQDEGLSMIGISCDGPRSISKVPVVINYLGIDYTILTDIDCEIMNTYQFQAFPTLIMLDSDNEVIYVHEGFRGGDEHEIQEAIETHIKLGLQKVRF